MNFEMLHPADQIVMIMNRIYHNGMTTMSGGNLSIMDDDGVMWISPSGIDKGSLRREDIMRTTQLLKSLESKLEAYWFKYYIYSLIIQYQKKNNYYGYF